jgi:hypothetical protein
MKRQNGARRGANTPAPLHLTPEVLEYIRNVVAERLRMFGHIALPMKGRTLLVARRENDGTFRLRFLGAPTDHAYREMIMPFAEWQQSHMAARSVFELAAEHPWLIYEETFRQTFAVEAA